MGIDIFVPNCFLGLGYFYPKRRNMTKQEIICMARQAGCIEPAIPDWVIRTCVLVASAEREACAGIVVNEAFQYASPVWAFEIVNDIKARGQA